MPAFFYLIRIVLFFYTITVFAAPAPQQERPDARLAISWNQQIFEIAIAEDKLLTLKGLRTAAMLHLAVHDALNSIEPVYDSYELKELRPDASPLAAAAQAGYEIAVTQYPDKKQIWVSERDKWLTMVPDSVACKKGIHLGKSAARVILDKRKNDAWNAQAEYLWHPMGPGVYAEFNEHSGTPQGFVFGAGWATAKPFMLKSQSHFRSPPPPAISSSAYTKAFNEVKEFGHTESPKRTKDQTHLAMWWKDFVENSHNRLARELATKEKLDLWQATRLFALLNMSVFDAYVNVFENKFHYNHWRPYTAIRWASNDGNPDTKPDSSWNNLHKHTYAFPSYPSAHGCASAAAMTVLEGTFGDRYSFTMTIPEVDKAGPFSGKVKTNPSTRSFVSFADAAMECALSRVYLGIHFRYDSEEGYKLGRRIGEYALERFLKKTK